MYALSEVCRKMGTTRQALRGYEDMGLLPPTEIAPNGQWMYDEIALYKLSLIQIFTEAGYSRKQVKAILDKPETIFDEMEKAADLLEEKRQHITGFITTLKFFLRLKDMPEQTQKLASVTTFDSITKGMSFSDQLNELIRIASQGDEAERDEFLRYAPFGTHIALLAQAKNLVPDSPEVQSEIEEMLKGILQAGKEEMMENEPESVSEVDFTLEANGSSMAKEIIYNLNGEYSEEHKLNLDSIYGAENMKAVIRALEIYVENHPEKEKPEIGNEMEEN